MRDGTHDSPQYLKVGHPFITSKNVKDGFINYEDIQYVSDRDFEEINKRSKVDKNDILMGMIGTIGNIALVREAPDFAIKNIALIKDIGKVFYSYLYHCLQSNSVVHQLDENLDGGTQKFIALNKIRELVIPVPSEYEQHKIGECMGLLDNLITLHQRKLEKLKTFKKAMLDKMFPKNGELVPEIRFSGFSDPWELRKLGELIIKGSSGGTPSTSRTEYYGGNIPFLTISDIAGRSIKSTERSITEAGLNNCAAWIVPSGAISLAMYASVGKVGILAINAATSQAFYNMLFDNNTLRDFAYCRLIKADLEHEWESVISTGTQRNLNAEKVKSFSFCVPKCAEMKLVSNFFWDLDNLITLHQRKLYIHKKEDFQC